MTARDLPEDQSQRNDPVWRMMTGAVAFVAGVFVCGAVGSYAPTDPSWNAATGLPASNLFGGFGAIFADLASQLLGWSSWFAGLLLMLGGARRSILLGAPSLKRWINGFVAIPLSAACFAAWPVPATWPLATGLGGVIGDALYTFAALPFAALKVPSPEIWAGSICGIAAFLTTSSAAGFGADDGQALADTLARQVTRLFRMVVRVASLALFVVPVSRWLWRQAGLLLRERSRPHEDFPVHGTRTPDVFKMPEDADLTYVLPDLPEDEPAPAPTPKPKRPTRKSPAKRPAVAGSKLPPLELLAPGPGKRSDVNEAELLGMAENLAGVLNDFGVKGQITEVRPGPVVTLFEFEPAAGVKSSRVIALADDIARSMSAISARVAVIPGKNAIGIELPNPHRETVYFRTLLEDASFVSSKASLPLALGENIGGEPVAVDLAKMPHLLIAGTTGSGKSVGINAMILSIMYKLPPEKCRFIMIDPKMLELSVYEGVPHLLAPVVIDPKKAVTALKWTVREMESRYELMSKAGVRNLAGFNAKVRELKAKGGTMTREVQTGFEADTGRPIYETQEIPLEEIPNIVVVIDEMADLMMVAGKEIEGCIQRLAQMARAAGIHLITATQRPSVDVITGTIKANFPTRISYMVTSKIDSRTILGEQGAEQLLGMGDLLYMAPGGKVQRLHGPFVADEEVVAVVDHLKTTGEPDYSVDITEEPEDVQDSPVMDAMLGGNDEADLYAKAVAVVVRDGRASTSYVQRRLKIGYNRAASLIERMEDEGVISAPNHAGKRDVLQKADTSNADAA